MYSFYLAGRRHRFQLPVCICTPIAGTFLSLVDLRHRICVDKNLRLMPEEAAGEVTLAGTMRVFVGYPDISCAGIRALIAASSSSTSSIEVPLAVSQPPVVTSDRSIAFWQLALVGLRRSVEVHSRRRNTTHDRLRLPVFREELRPKFLCELRTINAQVRSDDAC